MILGMVHEVSVREELGATAAAAERLSRIFGQLELGLGLRRQRVLSSLMAVLHIGCWGWLTLVGLEPIVLCSILLHFTHGILHFFFVLISKLSKVLASKCKLQVIHIDRDLLFRHGVSPVLLRTYLFLQMLQILLVKRC